MRLTAFIGAGAAIEIDGPTTNTITTKVRKKKQKFLHKSTAFIDRVAKVLDKHYDKEIYHVLEQINSFRTGWGGASKKFTPYMTAFAKPRLTRFFKDDITINNAKNNLIAVVAELIDEYDSSYKTKTKNTWHTDFWQQANNNFKLDIATLNYDTCIEQSISNLEDGFEPTEHNFERFNPRKLKLSTRSKIYHLHGCIQYGYGRTPNTNEYTLVDDFQDVYKFKTYKDASPTWFGRSTNVSQSSEGATIGPIITGLKKTDKVINFPYSSYYSALHDAIITNNSLLVVGYSFGDLHFNRLLERVVGVHGDKRRIVVITKFTGKAWHRDWTAMNWPEQRDMMVFMSKAFQDYSPFETGTYKFTSPIISKDGCARLGSVTIYLFFKIKNVNS
ncbi:MAG: SIR2 family protein [Flavobacteriales bacterium]